MSDNKMDQTVSADESLSEDQLDGVVGGSAKSFFKKLGHDMEEAAPYILPAIADGCEIVGEAIE